MASEAMSAFLPILELNDGCHLQWALGPLKTLAACRPILHRHDFDLFCSHLESFPSMRSFLQEDGETLEYLLLCIASNADFSRMCNYMPQAPPTQLSLAMHRAQAVLDVN